jgi:hypothetical protein
MLSGNYRQTQTSVFFGEPQAGTPAAMPYMAISGGHDKCIAYVTFDDSQFQSLTNPENPAGLVALAAGGERIEVAAKECVDLEIVLKAAKAYFERRELEPSLHSTV